MDLERFPASTADAEYEQRQLDIAAVSVQLQNEVFIRLQHGLRLVHYVHCSHDGVLSSCIEIYH